LCQKVYVAYTRNYVHNPSANPFPPATFKILSEVGVIPDRYQDLEHIASFLGTRIQSWNSVFLFHINHVAAAGESEIYEHYAKGEMDRPRLGVPFYIDLDWLIHHNDIVDFQVAVVGAQFVFQDLQYEGDLQENKMKYAVVIGSGTPCGKKHGFKGLHAEPYILGLLKKEDVVDLWDTE